MPQPFATLINQIQSSQTPEVLQLGRIDTYLDIKLSNDLQLAFQNNTSTTSLWLTDESDLNLVSAIGSILQSGVSRVRHLMLKNIDTSVAHCIVDTLTHQACRLSHLSLGNIDQYCMGMVAEAILTNQYRLQWLELRQLCDRSAEIIANILSDQRCTLATIHFNHLNDNVLGLLLKKLSTVPGKYRFEYAENISEEWRSKLQSISEASGDNTPPSSQSQTHGIAQLEQQLACIQQDLQQAQSHNGQLSDLLAQSQADYELAKLLLDNQNTFANICLTVATTATGIPKNPNNPLSLPRNNRARQP